LLRGSEAEDPEDGEREEVCNQSNGVKLTEADSEPGQIWTKARLLIRGLGGSTVKMAKV